MVYKITQYFKNRRQYKIDTQKVFIIGWAKPRHGRCRLSFIT